MSSHFVSRAASPSPPSSTCSTKLIPLRTYVQAEIHRVTSRVQYAPLTQVISRNTSSSSWACWKKSEDPTSKSSDILSDVFGAHFTYKSQRARANQQPTAAAAAGISCAGSASKRASALRSSGGGAPCLSPPSSVLLIACKGKNNPSPLSQSLHSKAE